MHSPRQRIMGQIVEPHHPVAALPRCGLSYGFRLKSFVVLSVLMGAYFPYPILASGQKLTLGAFVDVNGKPSPSGSIALLVGSFVGWPARCITGGPRWRRDGPSAAICSSQWAILGCHGSDEKM